MRRRSSTCVKRNAYDMLGPTCLLFSLTNEYEACMPLSAHTSGGTLGERCAAARITRAITSVAERETPHWQLQYQEGISNGEKRRGHTVLVRTG